MLTLAQRSSSVLLVTAVALVGPVVAVPIPSDSGAGAAVAAARSLPLGASDLTETRSFASGWILGYGVGKPH